MPQAQDSAPSREAIETWLIRWIANELGVAAEEIPPTSSLLDYSLSSVTATMLAGDLEDWLGLTLPTTLVWDYPSIQTLVDYLGAELKESAPRAGVPADATPRGAPIETSATEARQLLTDLDNLSDQEVSALLDRLLADGQGEVGLPLDRV
jgi:acyl carrier protein